MDEYLKAYNYVGYNDLRMSYLDHRGLAKLPSKSESLWTSKSQNINCV